VGQRLNLLNGLVSSPRVQSGHNIIIIVTGLESHTRCASRAHVVRLYMPYMGAPRGSKRGEKTKKIP
jgi:hypothetical protein